MLLAVCTFRVVNKENVKQKKLQHVKISKISFITVQNPSKNFIRASRNLCVKPMFQILTVKSYLTCPVINQNKLPTIKIEISPLKMYTH